MAKRAFSPQEVSMFMMANKNSSSEDASGSDDSDSQMNPAQNMITQMYDPNAGHYGMPGHQMHAIAIVEPSPVKRQRLTKKTYRGRSGRTTRATIQTENAEKVSTFAAKFPNLLGHDGILMTWFPQNYYPLYNVSSDAKPIEFFNLFFNELFWTTLVDETNRYAEQFRNASGQLSPRSKYRNWTPVTLKEMKAFMALCFAMGLSSKPNITDYWSSFWITETPGFSKIMRRDRFNCIRGFLHFNDNRKHIQKGQLGYDPLFKIRPLIDCLMPVFCKFYKPVPPAKHKTPEEIEADNVSKHVVYKTISECALTKTGPEMKLYPFPHGSKKWYVRIFDGLTTMAMVNSHTTYLQHLQGNPMPDTKVKKMDLRHYMEHMCGELLAGCEPIDKSPSRQPKAPVAKQHRHRIIMDGHFVAKGSSRDCAVCSDKKRESGRRSTKYYCEKCNVYLCPATCFKRYHTIHEYRQCHLDAE